MTRLSLLLASVAFVATPALAADIITEEPPAPAPVEIMAPTYTWSGLYIGGQAGVAFGNDGSSFSSDAIDFDGDDSSDDAGFVGGLHVGYDWQVNNWVFGAVADINYIDASSSTDFTAGGADFSVDNDIDYFGTVRGRLGYAFDRVLVYGTGGLAYAGVDNDASTPATPGVTYNTDNDEADFGYSVGGGVEVLATQNISFGVEYLYTNLGSNDSSVTAVDDATGAELFTVDSDNDDLDFHTVWAKASYRFN
ncbi:outer membrane protein [Mangrovicella endophytica]|uniref:outer membrane protein n=1 Tax=Mangrovicella endophytica TaxID=2066697 RepID=UPI000C9E26DC|nr:outer membrane protein [Mangrovicella endophytica]